MQTQTHPLISPALGTERHLTSFHYGPAGGQKIYIQSSLHADELPGMLVAWALRRRLAALEAAGKLRGEIVVVPVPNPIGLNQRLLGQMLGRYETGTASNFNRNFHDLAELVMPRVESRLTGDAQQNLLAVRAAMREALAEQTPTTELQSQRLALQRLSYDADVVLDLHCDFEAAMHLYTNPDLWPDVEPLARYLDAKASLLALNSIGNPFDEIHSFCWSELRARYGERYPIPNGSISVTIELRGQADVSYAFAEHDANAIVDYLTHRGVIDGTPAPLPPLEFGPTPFAGSEPLIAPISGVLVFRTPVGARVEPGHPIADIVDPLTERVVTIKNSVAGVLYARQRARFATAGMEVACVAGAEPVRGGSLLPD
ncbi:succinylglutamate desuccinylase/aspartoacylase family protein [Paraburkholderia silviterrae]|uniref:Succinylglutamate desuccinylase/aspartoacylase family protein n=1 Tax=Paraburkholderia silviterrae TaxID=2528715 RepID=A0A4R5M2J7_9BURK|nr:succinylglutamate desuccinylase/aspartoacylase family protein [Paraburkholderia silviterrae]TDG19730.1 succinylglutamate desuccinylase/aspartoacylase family protein [Paraburkholderia silviterrae]